MKKGELEHLLPAVGGGARDQHSVAFGSQAIWGLIRLHDLAVSNLVAGHKKDLAYIRASLKHKLVRRTILEYRLADTAVSAQQRVELLRKLRRLAPPTAKRT